jgi:hypothetical protein
MEMICTGTVRLVLLFSHAILILLDVPVLLTTCLVGWPPMIAAQSQCNHESRKQEQQGSHYVLIIGNHVGRRLTVWAPWSSLEAVSADLVLGVP